MKSRLSWILVAVAVASVAACGKASDGDAPEADAFAMSSGQVEDKFGATFGEAYRADPNSEPVTVRDGDLPAQSLTGEPVEVE